MASKVKDFLDLIKEIRGTTFNDDGSPKTGLWAEIKAWHTAIQTDKVTITNQIAAGDAVMTSKINYATEWANKAENLTISVSAGGGPGLYSAKHYAAKSSQSADTSAIHANSASEFALAAETSKNQVSTVAATVVNSADLATSASISAGNSATTASTQAAEATNSRNVAWGWANQAEDLAVNDGSHASGFSAYHWSQKAAAAVAAVSGITSFTQLTDAPASYVGASGKYLRVGLSNNIEFDILTKDDIGLSLVDNTSDANKPVSSITQLALDAKAPLASPVLTGIPEAPTAISGTDTTQLATTAYVVADRNAERTRTITLTNKTLTSPKIGTSILDVNGNEVLLVTATTSAVNEVTVTNAVTGSKPTLSASGSDLNITLNLTGKGTGTVQVAGSDIITKASGTFTSPVVAPSYGNTIQTIAYAATTAAWDPALGTTAVLTLTGNVTTLTNPSTLIAGAVYTLIVKQDATGSRLISAWGSNYKFPGGVKPVLSTAPGPTNGIDVITFLCDGVSLYGSYVRDMRV